MAGSALPIYFGTRDALRKILQEEGWRALYAGITPALLGAGMRPCPPYVWPACCMRMCNTGGYSATWWHRWLHA